MRKKESEKDLETALVQGAKERGGIAIKLTSQFHRGLPDRIVLLPYHTIAFVELKSTGEKRSALQEVMGRYLEGLGFRVFVIDSTEGLYEFFVRLDKRLKKQKARREEELD